MCISMMWQDLLNGFKFVDLFFDLFTLIAIKLLDSLFFVNLTSCLHLYGSSGFGNVEFNFHLIFTMIYNFVIKKWGDHDKKVCVYLFLDSVNIYFIGYVYIFLGCNKMYLFKTLMFVIYANNNRPKGRLLFGQIIGIVLLTFVWLLFMQLIIGPKEGYYLAK